MASIYQPVLLSTTHVIPGHRVARIIGLVTGMSVRTRGALGRFLASVEAFVGGRAESYVMELKRAREEAVQDLVNEARRLGANAVIGLDIETSEIMEGFIVITATGTAVVIEPERSQA